MRSKLSLDEGLVAQCREHARSIAGDVTRSVRGKSTVSVERTVARLFGVDGVDEAGVPLPNVMVDRLAAAGELGTGLAFWLGNAMIHTEESPQRIAERVAAGELDLLRAPRAGDDAVRARVEQAARSSWDEILGRQRARAERRVRMGEADRTLIYVLTATGNVHEDVVHARAVANFGGDIVAVIRSTAQSLLDYVPFGATTEGYGGTFATQENFRILRGALDEWSDANGRYVRLSSFSSGLCMPEIAAMGAIEGLDNMVNDALYGVLYRDINMVRTFIDQRVSRMVNGAAGLVINTGEDNYLRTADAVQAAPSVVASQMINYFLAVESRVPDAQIAVGNAFEIDPGLRNGFLYEWAQAQLTRELFPSCPVKLMPPTKHMDGNIFQTHAVDALFNLVTIATGQGIQTIGVPTEGIFTPHIQDRVLALQAARYVFESARELEAEVQFRPGGIIETRAREVLRAATQLLAEIREIGLFGAIEAGTFGDVRRSRTGGRGRDGIFETDARYLNPFVDIFTRQSS